MRLDFRGKPAPLTRWGRFKRWVWLLYWRIRHFFLRWSKVRAPVVNRTFPPLDAKAFCEVQPMTGPNGLIVQMSVKYGKRSEIPNTRHLGETND